MSFSYVQENLIFYLNGKRMEISGHEVDVQMTLADYLRAYGLTGTKIGCGEGGCGACTVMLSSFDHVQQTVFHRSVAACLLPLPYVDHMLVTTVEGIAPKAGIHPIQEHLAKKHGTQCGICSPGIVMSLYSTAMRKPELSSVDVEECLDGNLCRCTGYRSILEAAHTIAADYDPKKDGKLASAVELKAVCAREFVQQAVAFPEELKAAVKPLRIMGKTAAWYRPVMMTELLELKTTVPTAQVLGGKASYPDDCFETPQLVSGNTEIGYKARYNPRPLTKYPSFVSTSSIAELRAVEFSDKGVTVGVATTINGLIRVLQSPQAQKCGEAAQEGFKAVCNLLQFFANNQVRDMGTLGGSLVSCSPLSDLYPSLVCMNATIKLASKNTTRELLVDHFVLGDGKTDLQADEIAVSVHIPFTKDHEYAQTYKEAKRRVDAQSMVNGGIRTHLVKGDDGQWRADDLTIAFGALGPRAALRMKNTEEFLKGKPFNMETLTATTEVLRAELAGCIVRSRGAPTYRMAVACSLLCRFFAYVASKEHIVELEKEIGSALSFYEHHAHYGQQDYEEPAPGTEVGRPIPHLAADKHATGKAQFVGDIPLPSGCLHGAYIMAKRAHAKILKIHKKEAMEIPGVVSIITAEDIPGTNLLGSIEVDEEVFASKEVVFYGQPIGIVVAESNRVAQLAALKIEVEYEDLPSIQTIEDAIAAGSYLCHDKELTRGEAKKIIDSWPKERVVTGDIRSGGQEHFYIEPQACLVIPTGDNFFVRVTSQNPSKMQRAVATVLGIPASRVESRMERIGGGFGGKQDRPQFLAAAASMGSLITGKPVRMILERDQDMQITGQRHEFKTTYRCAFNPDGSIEAMDLQLWNNGGCSLDLSPAVMEVAMFMVDNCYRFPNMYIEGKCCRTNRVSCTAFRGFGKPQAMVITENILDHVSRAAGIPTQLVRDINLLRPGDKLMDNTPVEDNLFECWKPLHAKYQQRLQAVQDFNAQNRYKKRGLALVPSRNNVGFEADCLNQGGCVINVYLDGTVFISHGGSEMGQGLSTKCAQIAADALHIPVSLVVVGSTATDRVPNTTATAASTGSDLNGSAVLDGATRLRARLDKVAEEHGIDKSDWNKLVGEAYNQRVWLSEIGHYKMEKYAYNWETKIGRSTLYHIWGASLCEVELDVLTGHWRATLLEVLQDVGKSLNPAIDIGQIEGGLLQGIGLFTLEEFNWARDGHLRTRNVSTYKIPTHDDVPLEMNVSLLKGSKSALGVLGNKSPSEVGIQLAGSVLCAIKDAIYAARSHAPTAEEAKAFVRIDTPATPERIRLACPTPFDVKP